MELPIPKEVKKLWDVWNLRGSVLLSLFLQVLLVLFASLRQRSKGAFLLTLVWLAYLLADWVAAVAIGLITKSQGDICDHPKGNPDLFAFWASFLLLHLGGPDSITSFALEDNEFWLRHLFGLLLQVLAAFYSFYLTLPKNRLWPPTILVFVAGIIKYAERTRALYLASLDHFGVTALPKPDPGPDYEEAADVHSSMRSLQVPTSAGMVYNEYSKFSVEEASFKDLEEIKLLKEAYRFFQIFKGLIVGFFVSVSDRRSTRNSFLKADYRSAFRVIEYEFSFIFQVLHTKVVVARSKTGYILRFICFSFILGASIFFYLVEKHGFGKFETGLTYALLVGAMVLDSISLVKLIAFSDWTLIVLKESWRKHIPKWILERKRWSRLVFQYDMISYCLDKRWRIPLLYKLAGLLHARGFLDKIKIMWYSSSENVTEDLEKFIFEELTRKSRDAGNLKDAMESCKQRGESALLRLKTSSYIKLKWSIGEYQYAESLLLWHLATQICCLAEKSSPPAESSSPAGLVDRICELLLSFGKRICELLLSVGKKILSVVGFHKNNPSGKRVCAVLSDYMFYLSVMQPAMLSSVLGGNWYVVFQDTCEEAQRYFQKHSISKNDFKSFEKLIKERPKFRPAAVKGVGSKSVFFDACILAQQLRGLENKWELMDQVWMEMVGYAAINCRPIIHAQQPSKGGELFTFIWLLMYHFGLGTNFSEQEEIAGTKMVAVKY
ncbi:hypothetical protein UlMin_007275 [Ulmus minor]